VTETAVVLGFAGLTSLMSETAVWIADNVATIEGDTDGHEVVLLTLHRITGFDRLV
jgi:hypothetical protein